MTAFMLLGGVSDDRFPMDLIRRFVEIAGGSERAFVFLIPAATEQAEKLSAKYESAFRTAGCRSIATGCFAERDTVDSDANMALLDQATAVFFTGGDQLRLLEGLRGTRFAGSLMRRSLQGMPVGGSSAGAMALGHPVIVRGRPEEYLTVDAIRFEPGLSLLPGIVVDTHLTERHRIGRLIHSICRHPDAIGIGIDENTGVLIESGDTFEVFGPGSVTLLHSGDRVMGPESAASMKSDTGSRLTVENIVLNIYKSGDRSQLRKVPVAIDNQ